MKASVWVTSCISDEEARNCLILRETLRRTLSGKRVIVIVSQKVSQNLQGFLWKDFHQVVTLPENWNRDGLTEQNFARIWVLALKEFDEIIYLYPASMVLKNPDHLFKVFNNAQLALPGDGKPEIIFGVKPRLFNFQQILNADFGNLGLEKLLEMGFLESCVATRIIDEVFIGKIPIPGLALELNIVNLKNKDDKIWNGVYEQSILELWTELNNMLEERLTGVVLESFIIENPIKEKIAIIGMSGRYPGANDLQEFWNILKNGKDATGSPPAFRAEGFSLNAGFLKDPIDQFDGQFFGISRSELEVMDPQQRLLLEVVWEALENAGISSEEIKTRHVGVFSGSWTNDYKDILLSCGKRGYFRNYLGNSIGAGAARISSLLGSTGPCISTESGCSSSMVAVHMACKSLLQNESDLALACGVNLLLLPYDETFLPQALSVDGRCKTFDVNANGFGRAEGCGVVVLRRLSDAVMANDKIWAVIRGSAVCQEGLSTSLGTPTEACEALAMRNALEDAGIEPCQVSYVEAHGTATVVGDPIEMSAMAKVYSKDRMEPLLVTSLKTNIGHTESCAGIAGITKVALALHYELIPPHRNLELVSPAIATDLNSIPARIPLQAVEWKRNTNERIAGVSLFGITGSDAHVIVEEAPELKSFQIREIQERPKHLLKLSAKTEEALEILLRKYQEMLSSSLEKFPDVAYTANVGRTNFPYRAALIADGNDSALKILKDGRLLRGEAEKHGHKVCFLFTGQGSQFHGMAKELHSSSPVFRVNFDYCKTILEEKYKIDIASVIWSDLPHPLPHEAVGVVGCQTSFRSGA